MSYILGISAFFHDSAACLLHHGNILSAVQEERFTRIKHDPSFPKNAILYCLKQNGITINDCEAIVFFEKPFLKFERILDSVIETAPFGFKLFTKAIPIWLKEKLFMKSKIIAILKKEFNFTNVEKLKFSQHHISHAASAFYPSGFKQAAVVVVDGVGEKSTCSIFNGNNSDLTCVAQMDFPHSLGLFYSTFTRYCGFKVNSGEYKLMGLAPLGKPIYVEEIKKYFIHLQPNGSFSLNMTYFGFTTKLDSINKKFIKHWKNNPRKDSEPLTPFFMDMAASVQVVCNEVMLGIVKHAIDLTKSNSVCLAGGVALNCVTNTYLKKNLPNMQFWVQPAAGDAGAAYGCAIAYFKNKYKTTDIAKMNHAFWGPSYTNEEILKELIFANAVYSKYSNFEISILTAKLILNNKVVGVFTGKAEFGPRALGNRSILANAKDKNMQEKLNAKIKYREDFRPFAPIVQLKDFSIFFNGVQNEFMLFTSQVLNTNFPSITHKDGSARVQVVDEVNHPFIYSIIDNCKELADIPVLINTSFNVRGEPPVLSPTHAYNCFMSTEMDALVFDNYVLLKENQPLQNKKVRTFVLD